MGMWKRLQSEPILAPSHHFADIHFAPEYQGYLGIQFTLTERVFCGKEFFKHLRMESTGVGSEKHRLSRKMLKLCWRLECGGLEGGVLCVGRVG